MKQAGCYLCKSTEYTIFKKTGSYQLMKCKRCGLVYLPRTNVRREVKTQYTSEYHIEKLVRRKLETEREIAVEIDKNIGRAKEIVTHFGERRKLLDIGCGAGFFIACLKRYGWDVTGVDISEWAGKFATERLGLKVYTGKAEDILFHERFDVITMYHILEHLPDPLETLKKVSSIITDEGMLIIKGPNFDSFDRIWHGNHWRGYDLPFHLCHFTPTTYSMMLSKACFSVQKILFQHWNPVTHLLEIQLGDGIRADHPPDAISGVRQKIVYNNYIFASIAKMMCVTARVCGLKGRDLTIYARKRSCR